MGSSASRIHTILRLGVSGCFIGHGAFGFLLKRAWLPYFGVVGIGPGGAARLMPWIGAMDVSLGILTLVVPMRFIFLHLTLWGLWTAALRPLSGEPFAEMIERAGNYGVPLALLFLLGFPRRFGAWFSRISVRDVALTDRSRVEAAILVLRVTVFLLLLGHGLLGIAGKAGLSRHYESIGLGTFAVGGLSMVQAVGWFEVALAALTVFVPRYPVLAGVCAWKMITEGLFLTSGAPVFEWIERAGSYAAPLALVFLLSLQRSLEEEAGQEKHGEREARHEQEVRKDRLEPHSLEQQIPQ